MSYISVSAFYFECPEKQICMNASIYTKSRFMGMSIGVNMIGKGKFGHGSYGSWKSWNLV